MNTVLQFFSHFILEGKIPQSFISFAQKILLFLAFVPLVGIFFLPMDYRNLGELSWKLLLLIVFLRPLSDIFPEFKILKRVLPLRKEVGILCGTLAIAHSIGFFLNKGISLENWFVGAQYWDMSQHFFWGILGFIIAVVLTITSNTFSIKLLKRNWKKLHKFTYLFVVFVALHIALIAYAKGAYILSTDVLAPLFVVVLLVVVLFLSAKKITFKFFTSAQ